MIERLQATYGFTRMPFGRDLAPQMLHRHTAHNEAVARITWGIDQHALGVLTGEVGVGKTVAARAALASLDPTPPHPDHLPNPTVGTRGIHHAIVTALGGSPRPHRATLIPQAADSLATEHAERGRTPVLVIDEAHLLDHDQLEGIRMLTNHDLDRSSPLACLLVGQPTLRRKIKLGVLAALDQRIAVRYHMPGMSLEETTSYLRHHLHLAGRADTLFAEDAVALIHQTSRGYPARSTTSPCRPCWPPSPPTRASSTRPPPAPPSPRSRPSEHHAVKLNSTPRPAPPGGASHIPQMPTSNDAYKLTPNGGQHRGPVSAVGDEDAVAVAAELVDVSGRLGAGGVDGSGAAGAVVEAVGLLVDPFSKHRLLLPS